jgi:hypothetical protein
MTRVPATTLTDRHGRAVLARICAQAGMLLHDLNGSDVGIDGLIEDVVDGAATGFFVAVQLKTGRSYFRGGDCVVRAGSAHRAYWAGCVLPVIAVVVDPGDERAWWTSLSTPAVGTTSAVVFKRDASTAFTRETLRTTVMPVARRSHPAHADPGEAWRRRANATVASVPQPVRRRPTTATKLRAWTKLIEVLFATTSTDQLRANAGYRLAWYEPAVTPAQRDELRRALHAATDEDLRRLVDAVDYLVSEDGEHAANVLAGDLIAHIPDAAARIHDLILSRALRPEVVETAEQVRELIDENP